MGKTSATTVTSTSALVKKSGDTMTGTLVVPAVTQVGAATSATTNYTTVTGDAGARYAVYADGKQAWGAGTGALDTNLYRNGADTLKTDDAFVAGSTLSVTGTTTANGVIQVVRAAGSTSFAALRSTGDTQYRYVTNVDGLMSWGDGTGAQDTNLYRTSAGVLKSDGAINAVNGFQVNGVGLGAWTSYTPTLTGTGWALGNAAVDATYARVGKTVFYRVQIVWGSTSTYGSVQPIVSLPSTMVSAVHGAGTATAIDVGTTLYHWDVYYTSSTTVKPVVRGVDGATTNTPTGTVPFAWASGDALLIHGWYQEA